MKSYILVFLMNVLAVAVTSAQISPPGLGETNTGSWVAFGVRQALDSANKIQSFSYVGVARISGPASNDPFKLHSIVILNQEFYHKFHTHWHYSLALSYRNQNEYWDGESFNTNSPIHKQEFRIYGRYMYELKVRNIKFAAAYRQEFRSFFNSDFEQEDNRYQIRSRFRIQGSITLDKNKAHRLTASAEALFSSTQSTNPENHWSTFGYQDARFCFYYSFDPKSSSLIYSIGYMNNLIGLKNYFVGNYIALDIIWENPFKKFKREALKPIE